MNHDPERNWNTENISHLKGKFIFVECKQKILKTFTDINQLTEKCATVLIIKALRKSCLFEGKSNVK